MKLDRCLLALPGTDEAGKPLADITVQPKFEVKEDSALIEYRVIVLWEDAPTAYRALSEGWKHPESVDVYLHLRRPEPGHHPL